MYIEYDMDYDRYYIGDKECTIELTPVEVEELYANLTGFLGKEADNEVPPQI